MRIEYYVWKVFRDRDGNYYAVDWLGNVHAVNECSLDVPDGAEFVGGFVERVEY